MKFEFLPCVVASIVAMVFLRRICSSRPGDGEQRGQSLAALTAHGRGLGCFQPCHGSLSCVKTNSVSFASAQVRKLNRSVCFSFPHEVGYFVGTPFMARHCVSKQVGRHDAVCQGCPRRVFLARRKLAASGSSRAPCAFSQPAVLSALLVIQLFGIVIPPPEFS